MAKEDKIISLGRLETAFNNIKDKIVLVSRAQTLDATKKNQGKRNIGIYTGTGEPDSSLGTEGDIYVLIEE